MALVVFLRGCNVGGHRRFRPSALAAELKRFGVINIGAAGTLVVLKRVSRAKLREELRRRLPFDADIMMCEGRDLLAAMAAAPFREGTLRAGTVRFLSVLTKRPRQLPALPLALPADAEWVVRIFAAKGRFLFGEYRRQMKTIGYLGAIDTLFGARATTRNWSTLAAVRKVLAPDNP